MFNKIFKIIFLLVLAFGFSTYNAENADAATKVMWGKTELKLGQIGKVTILTDTTLVKLEGDGSLSTVRAMKKGEEYRVYSYKNNHGGLYGVGGGSFVQKNTKVKYETPSKSKLSLLNGQAGNVEFISGSVWEGTYTANQGETRLTLTVKEETVEFAFGPTLTNPKVPEGKFIMFFEYDKVTGALSLEQGKWIQKPSGYIMLDLVGSVSGDYYTGVVLDGNSVEGKFSVKKIK
ncbi:hypothetical protein PGC35_02455 [Psychrobacillus sp. PGGUH221]|uniref:hypothetical protein n=1 Tax=Psychrobacillus sp. PGGUH221 TaxID=3020058 RepID=UPI0035C71D05